MHRLLLILLLLLAALPPARAAGADDLLEPDKAFRFSAHAIDARTVEVRYGIAEGYYLYLPLRKLSLAQCYRSGPGRKTEALAKELVAFRYSIPDFHAPRVDAQSGKSD